MTTDAIGVLIVAAIAVGAIVFVSRSGRRAVAIVLACAFAATVARGWLLALALAVGLEDVDLTVNAIAPALTVAALLGLILSRRRLSIPRILALGIVAFLAPALLDFGTQDVGIRIYGLGLAQYAAYPLCGLVVWQVLDDERRRNIVSDSMVAAGVVVAVSILLEAGDLVRPVEAVAAVDPVSGTPRYGGATGSYLHASIFLGTVIPIAIAQLLDARAPRTFAIYGAVLGLLLGGLALTYSRGGMGIAILGALVLLLFAPTRVKARLALVIAAGAAVLLVAGTTSGISPAEASRRVASGFDWRNDPANQLRLQEMKRAVSDFERAPTLQKLFGEGLAATGNARKLEGLAPRPTENYFLKVLIEAGALGFILIGAFVAFGVLLFIVVGALARADPRLAGVCAAGVALSVYGLLYPILEPQLLGFAWWMLIAATAFEAPSLARSRNPARSLRTLLEWVGREWRFCWPRKGGRG